MFRFEFTFCQVPITKSTYMVNGYQPLQLKENINNYIFSLIGCTGGSSGPRGPRGLPGDRGPRGDNGRVGDPGMPGM